MYEDFQRGEDTNRLIDAAYRGSVSRRAFFKGLVAAGVSVTVALDMAEHAALAQINQELQLAKVKDEYDYIVVGAGSSGCVMAHRLSQDGRFSVLLIEGGGTDIAQDKISNALAYPKNFGTETDWGNKTVPQAHLNNRVIPTPVGKVIGGGSSINATVWLKGDRSDYDQWEQIAGPNWSFAAIIAGFKKADRYAGGESEYRGGNGMIVTRKPSLTHPCTAAFIESAKELGRTEQLDVNGVASVGNITGQQDVNADASMRRISTAQAYLYPALLRTNITLLPNAAVTRLEVEAGTCRGVSVQSQGSQRKLRAAREVILCAGALQSPKLLMTSGIGPAAHLRQLGIPIVVDSPKIGQNLQDHMSLRLYFSSKSKMPPTMDTGHSGLTYLRTSNAPTAGPNFHFFSRQDAAGSTDVSPENGYMMVPGMMKPKSRGEVLLTSADPSAPLLVNPNYMAEQADVDDYAEAVAFALEIGNAKGFAPFRKEQISLRGAGKPEIVKYIREIAGTYFHYVGTCAMGKDQSAPVDESLRVRGVERLRVVDASVIPTLPCCNTHAPVLALAERAASLIAAG